jgi:sporulation protein YlmC with PRC-barrel domain
VISFENLIGYKVLTSEAFSLGIVKGALVDTEKWTITYLHVKINDEAATRLGFKKRFRSSTICLPVSMVKAIGDYVTIGRSLDELGESQEITECNE